MAALPSIGTMMDRGGGGGEGSSSVEPSRKRLRVSHACDVCRARKIRCDGNTPCAACAAADCDCTYGSEANSRGKSDLILEGVLRLERMLQEMNLGLSSSPISQHATAQQLPFSSHRAGSIGGSSSFSGSPLAEVHLSPFLHHAAPHSASSQHHQPQQQQQQPPYHSPPPHQRQQQQPQQQQPTPTGSSSTAAEPQSIGNGGSNNNSNSLENAVLDSMHTSTTESILQWPHFDVFPSLRRDYVSIFTLERGRRPPRARWSSSQPPPPPRVAPKEVDRILDSFQSAVNFWYPTASVVQLERCRAVAVAEGVGSRESGLGHGHGEEDDDDEGDQHAIDRCLAYLFMALGCASQVVAGLVDGHVLSEEEMRFRRARRSLADLYFDQVLGGIHVMHTAVGSAATHCLFLVGLYFAFLRRPLQAWEYINAASARCLLLLSYQAENDEDDEDQERIRRIFWSCYILESDYLAELSGLPQSGIARIESSIPLPGKTPYKSHRTPVAAEQSSLYFLACISMRRLLNRVHQLLYARGTGASLDTNRFPYVVAELDHQLEDWRDVLPAAFAFTLDARPCSTEHGGFLRQRYLTCRSVIYRPYLMWTLSGAQIDDPSLDAGATARCLDACLLHMLNLRGFGHTVLVDTWICALSMAGAMCLLLAACRTPALRDMLAARDVLACGRHLGRLFESWTAAMGGQRSPSIEQSVRIIAEADRFIRELYGSDMRVPEGGWSADHGRRDDLARG
ncbi:hypothetical protein MCOR08_002355 [Pyricularia oryzae]|nr:hypothetical protein MCOR08_002355 [Pyricularia oryzae]